MAQKYDLQQYEDITPQYDLQPPEQEQSDLDWWIEQGLRTGPAVIGSLAGSLGGGIPTLGLGAMGGGMAGGAAGSAVGNLLGNWYSGKKFNPYEFGVTTAFGAAPPILGPAKFAGTGLGAIAKYAGKTAAQSALEGAAVNVVQTPFDQWAQTGSLNAPLENYIQNAGAGALFGGALGGTIGAYHGKGLNQIAPPRIPPPDGAAPPEAGWLPFGDVPQGRPPIVEEPDPTQMGLPFDDPLQMDLPFGAYRGQSGRFTNKGPGMQPTVRPFLEEPIPQSFDFGEPLPPSPPPPPPPVPPVEGGITAEISGPQVIPEGSILSGNQQVVTIEAPSAELNAYWRGKGYVSVAGLRDSRGYPQMVRGDVAPLYVTGDKRPSPAPIAPQARPDVPGAIGEGQTGVVEGQDIPVSHLQASDPKFIANMRKNGYGIAERTSTQTIFRKLFAAEEGTFDPMQMWSNLKRLLGRDPTPQEVEQGMARQVQPGEQTGRVAQFPDSNDILTRTPSQAERFWEPDPNDPLNNQPPIPTDQLQAFLDNAPWLPEAPLPPFMNPPTLPDLSMGQVTQPESVTQAPGLPELGPVPTRPAEMQIPPTNGGLDVEGLRQRSLFTPSGGIPEVSPVFEPRAPQMGQQELPLIGEARPPTVPEAVVPQRVVTETRQPKQLNLEDAEVQELLRNKDVLPPDTKVSTWRKIKSISKEFLDNESGEFDHEELMRNLRRTLDEDIESEHLPPSEAAMVVRRRQQTNDLAEINETNDPVRAREIEGFWREELRRDNMTSDADAQKHSARMLQHARIRAQDLETNARPQADEAVPVESSGESDVQYWTNAVREWDRRIAEYRAEGDTASVERVTQSRNFAQSNLEDAMAEARNPTPRVDEEETVNPSPDRTSDEWEAESEGAEITSAARAATGVPNPPVTLGLQPPRPRGERPLISKEKYAKLRASGDSRVKTAGEGRRSKYLNRRNTWDNWADQYLADAKDGEPGLSIEDLSPEWSRRYPESSKAYHVVYRGTDGKPIALAKVREEGGTGIRTVGILAANRFKGFASGRAVKAVGQALVDMNATEASGSISDYTARLIAKLAGLVKENAGSFSLRGALDSLRKLKEDVLGGKPLRSVPIKSADDVAKLMDNMSEGQTGLRWLASKAKELVTDETGARPVAAMGEAWQKVKGATGWGQGEVRGSQADKEFNFVKEALAVPSNATTMLDLSAPGRQGLTQILTPQFWRAAGAMFKGLSYNSFKQIDTELKAKPIMRKRMNPDGTFGKSFAEEIGTKMFAPASEPGPRAEATASRWLEMGIGQGIGSKIWRNTAGVPIRATNRAFITFLNHLNVNRTEFLLNRARDMSIQARDTGKAPMQGILGGVRLPEMLGGGDIGFKRKYTPEQAQNLNPYENLPLAKEIAEFVNTATGHAPLRVHYLPFKQTQISLEGSAKKLSSFLFSPGLLFSRARMMSPSTYIMASPYVRKQYAKAAISTAAAWFAFSELAKMADPEAEISNDPTSADFGKVRIGDSRLDLGGGFLQFAVAYGRAYMGGSTSSASGEFHRFGSGYQAQTQEDMMERFFVNKLNPVAKFAYDVYNASEYNPFHVGDRAAQLFVPLFIQDLVELAKEDPELLPWMGKAAMGTAALLGGGTQIYGKGESVAKLVPEEQDWLVTGGGLRDLMPWNWSNEPGEESRPFPWSER